MRVIKGPERGESPGSAWGPGVIMRVFQEAGSRAGAYGDRTRQEEARVSNREAAALQVGGTVGHPTRPASGSPDRRGSDSLRGLPEGMQPYRHIDLNPQDPSRASDLENCEVSWCTLWLAVCSHLVQQQWDMRKALWKRVTGAPASHPTPHTYFPAWSVFLLSYQLDPSWLPSRPTSSRKPSRPTLLRAPLVPDVALLH